MQATAAEFLANLYQPPLKRFPTPIKHPHRYAKAAAWGQALSDWLGAYQNENTLYEYRHAVAGLLDFCRKLPWEVHPADVDRWLLVDLAGKAGRTRNLRLQRARAFYRYACGLIWISPAGRRLRLCRADPLAGLAPAPVARFQRVAPLSEHQLGRLLAAFDLHTSFGRRDHALFTVILETGLPLRRALALRLRDLQSGFVGEPDLAASLPQKSPALERGRQAACQIESGTSSTSPGC